MIEQLLTGRLWLRDTSTGELFRRATLSDVVRASRLSKMAPATSFPADGRWAAFEMVGHVGFDLSQKGGFPPDTKCKLIGVRPF